MLLVALLVRLASAMITPLVQTTPIRFRGGSDAAARRLKFGDTPSEQAHNLVAASSDTIVAVGEPARCFLPRLPQIKARTGREAAPPST